MLKPDKRAEIIKSVQAEMGELGQTPNIAMRVAWDAVWQEVNKCGVTTPDPKKLSRLQGNLIKVAYDNDLKKEHETAVNGSKSIGQLIAE